MSQPQKNSKKPPQCKKCGGSHWPFQPCIRDCSGKADKLAENLISETFPNQQLNDSISKSIEIMANSPASLPGQIDKILNTALINSDNLLDSLKLSASQIMQDQIGWIRPDDTVESGLRKMNQLSTEFLLVGKARNIHGIVSHSDLMAAVSPYLKPSFSKWKTPGDEATLQIRIKWIMNRFYDQVTEQSGFYTILNQMQKAKTKCLVVTSEKSKPLGLITIFNIFHCLIRQPHTRKPAKKFNPVSIIKSIELRKKNSASTYINEFLQ